MYMHGDYCASYVCCDHCILENKHPYKRLKTQFITDEICPKEIVTNTIFD